MLLFTIKSKLCFLLVYSLPFTCLCQVVDSLHASFDGEVVNIYYNLNSKQKADLFDVSLFSSYDNYQKPLTSVIGDVGAGVSTGNNKKIKWLPKTEYVKFDEKITFELRASLISSPLSFTNPLEAQVLKKGKTQIITWQGGIANEPLIIDLYKNNQKWRTLDTLVNKSVYENKYLWKIPGSLAGGDTYQLRISGADKPEIAKMSERFAIRARYPLMLKLIPVAAIATVVIIKLWPEPTEKMLEEPPKPPQ